MSDTYLKLKERKNVQTTEYAPVPTRGQYRGTSLGYGAKRFLGGGLWRTVEFPQQYLYAMLAGAQGRLPDDWNMGTPFARIVYPGRYPRIRTAAVTGTENSWVNLAADIALDPLNLVGGIGAVTRLGKAGKLVSGLAKAREVKGLTALRGFGAIEETRELLKAAGRAGGAGEIEKAIKGIIGTGGKWDAYKPLAESWDEFGETVFEEATRLSEALRTGKATVFGAGLTTGYGGVAGVDIGKALREPVARGMERIEDVWQGIKHGVAPKYSPYGARPEAIVAKAGTAQMANLPKLQWLVKGLRDSAKWDANSYFTKMGIDIRKKWLDDYYSQFPNAKDANKMLADLITGKQPPKGLVSNKTLTSYWNLMQDTILSDEQTARDVTNLGIDYIARILKTNDKGMRASNAFYDFMMGKVADSVKGLGKLKKWQFRRAAGQEPFISVTNLSHFARARDSSKRLKKMVQTLNEAQAEASRLSKHETVRDIIKAKDMLTKVADLWDNDGKVLDVHMSPHEVNTSMRQNLGKEIDEFMKSRAGREFGFSDISKLDDFEFFEEDFRKIIPERVRRYAQTTTHANILGRFLKQFGFSEKVDPLAYEEARRLAGYTKDIKDKWNRHTHDIAITGATQDLVHVPSYLEKTLGCTSDSIKSIIGKMAGGDINDLYMSEGAANAFADLLKAWEKLPEDAWSLKAWDKVNQYWARMTLFGGRASYIFNNLTGDRWNMYLAGARGRHLSGISGLQVMLPESKTLKGFGGVVGLADNDIALVSKVSGISYTKKQVLDMISQFDIDGGLFDSALFETIDKDIFKKLPTIKEVGQKLAKGELTAPMRAIAQFTEKNGRYSLFMHFLEEGYHPADAAQEVAKYLFDYSKQNQNLRRIAPFYYWTYKNVPLQFRNMFLQPAKQRLPQKFQWAFESNTDPTEDAKPEYLQAKGIYINTYKGKDVYLDLSNVPPMAAQEALGLLNTPEGFTGIMLEASKRAAVMASPLIQIGFEFATKRDLFTGMPIVSGGAGAIPESGTKEFLGFNIQGVPTKQVGAQIARTLVTPLDIVDSLITQAKRPAKRLPIGYNIAKVGGGVPFRQVNPKSAKWINLSKERNKYLNLVDHYEAIGNKGLARKYRLKADEINKSLNILNKQLKEEKEREERRGRR